MDKWTMYDEIREQVTLKEELDKRIRRLTTKKIRLRRELNRGATNLVSNYGQERVQNGYSPRATIELMKELSQVLEDLKYAEEEYKETEDYLNSIDEIFTKLNDKEKTIYKEKVLYGLNSIQIAKKIGQTPPYYGITDRQVRYYLESIEEKYGTKSKSKN